LGTTVDDNKDNLKIATCITIEPGISCMDCRREDLRGSREKGRSSGSYYIVLYLTRK
jgi:hypothetical protein